MTNLQLTSPQNLIQGQWVATDATLAVHDPEDGSVIGRVPDGTDTMMADAIAGAAAGADIARRLAVHERQSMLRHAADLVESRAETFAYTIACESSKTIREGRAEVRRAVDTLRLASEESARLAGETIAFDRRPGAEGRRGYYERVPLGVVAAITPFNDPLNLVVHKVGPALAAGNAVVLKPASATPLSALLLVETLLEAGVPPEVLSVVTGSGSRLGGVLVSHPAVAMVSFTGGLATGEAIARQAGLKKLAMELGANSPVLVLADADVDRAADAIASGAFSNAGQNCLGVQRVFVADSVTDRFMDQLVGRTRAWRMGSKLAEDTDMGPMIHEREAVRIGEWVAEAVAGGAEVLVGGTRQGAFYAPTVMGRVPRASRLYREEVYGPVVSVFPVSSVDEAIARANEVPYGLQAGVFTRSLDLAHRCIRELNVGGVMVNDSSDFRVDHMPFGGFKGSGLGREGVRYAAEAMTETKVVCFNLSDAISR